MDPVSRRVLLAGAASAILLAACERAGLPAGEPSSTASLATGMRWPAEWEPHASTMMSMPFSEWIYDWRQERLPGVQAEWAAVARAIARFEPVTMVIPNGQRREMSALLGPDIHLVEAEYDDGWLRDNGPIFLSDGVDLAGLDFVFNGWGGAFRQPFEADDALPEALLTDMGVPRASIDMVLEGGAIQGDGAGTIITTEECLLNPNRNPSTTKRQIEDTLRKAFHASKVIWLPYGLIGDLTSGHVDGVCQFIGPGRVIAQVAPHDAAENARLQANVEVLRSETDALGRELEIVPFPVLPRARFADGPPVSHCYINFYPTNRRGLVVPLAGLEGPDREAMQRLRAIFPDRQVVGVPTPFATWAGGGVHCITQQVPAVG